MKKITCVGFHATGSGAVDDFLREFDNIVAVRSGIECRFLQDPDGISDLEYNLIENPHRLNSGFAIKRYLKFAKKNQRTYKKIFGDEWLEITNDYISSLSKFKYKGYWHADITNQDDLTTFIYKARRFINMHLPKCIRKSDFYNYFPKEVTYFSDLTKEEFYKITKKYCEDLCKVINKNNLEYVILDQAVSPQNIDRYLNYIDDIKIIVVDRDPRDVYIDEVKLHDIVVIPEDVSEFCDVYVYSRKIIESKSKNVLWIQFEDLINKYDDTTKKIMKFLNLKEDNHINKLKYFDPSKSIKNTRLWEKHPEYAAEAKLIEQKLANYLYKGEK